MKTYKWKITAFVVWVGKLPVYGNVPQIMIAK